MVDGVSLLQARKLSLSVGLQYGSKEEESVGLRLSGHGRQEDNGKVLEDVIKVM